MGDVFGKWLLFVINLMVMAVLLMIAFLVPNPPTRYGKAPEVAMVAVLSAVLAAVTGYIFIKQSREPRITWTKLLLSLPCICEIAAVALVCIPMVNGFLGPK